MPFILRTASGEAKAKFSDDLALKIVSQSKVRVETRNLDKSGPMTRFTFEEDFCWGTKAGWAIYILDGDFLHYWED